MMEFIFGLFNMFLYMLQNIKILVLYGIFLASFSLIPKAKSYYLAKNFVLIWFVSAFLFGSVLFCCSYVLLLVLSGSNYFFIIHTTEWLILYGATSYPIIMISSILLTLIRFLMVKDTINVNPLNKQQIKIVCIVSCINCALSPIFYIMFVLF
ncbi:hypothetical protein [Helicobacter sp. T3_23-1056]